MFSQETRKKEGLVKGKAGDKRLQPDHEHLACEANELDFILQVMGSHLRDVGRKGALSNCALGR